MKDAYWSYSSVLLTVIVKVGTKALPSIDCKERVLWLTRCIGVEIFMVPYHAHLQSSPSMDSSWVPKLNASG